MKKTVIEKKITVNALKDKVWDALADFGNVQNMSPGVAKSYLTSDQAAGIGTTRHCDLAVMGAQVEERIIGWDEGNSLKISLYETKNMPMVVDIEAYFEVKEVDSETELVGKFEYGMSNGIGSLMNSLMMKKMNEKTWVNFMAGIKHFVETGEKVDKNTVLDLVPVLAA
jgi:carbon monoxide dehydrogenase subunit G